MNQLTSTSATALFLLAMANTAPAQSLPLDFQETASSWQTVVDGVMGGRSTGRVRSTPTGTLMFTGKLSLENNGGFSQIRTRVAGKNLADAKGLVLECRGDGRQYNFNLRVSNARMMAGGFQAPFQTVADKWVEIELPFEQFELFSFGRRVRKAPELNPGLIESIGVTLSDKKPGDFALEIRNIRALTDDGKQATGGDAGTGNDLASVAENAGLTTLLELVAASGLKLPNEPVTIFAPTNDAFAAIPAATRKKLLEPESRETLQQILKFHITTGRQSSADVLNRRSLPSLAGQPLRVAADKTQIEGAGIVAVDVAFDNGTVHVIDKVMMPEQRSIVAIASADKRLATLLTAVNSAGLTQQLQRRNGPWTVFAPVDSAFAKLPKETIASLLEPENRQALTAILGLHVVPGRISSRDLVGNNQLTSLLGEPIQVALQNGRLTVGDGAGFVATDIQAANGVIHLIDRVLLPKKPAAQARSSATSLNERASRIYALAVQRGVGLFNGGSPEACAAVYEVAVESMLDLAGDELDAKVRRKLEEGRTNAKQATTWRDRAWAFRRALDGAYAMLRPTRTREALPSK